MYLSLLSMLFQIIVKEAFKFYSIFMAKEILKATSWSNLTIDFIKRHDIFDVDGFL